VLSYHVTSDFCIVCATKTVELFSALSVPRLYNTSALAAKKSPGEILVEVRGSRVIEQEMARRLQSDLKR
jgi:hypothetical protein